MSLILRPNQCYVPYLGPRIAQAGLITTADTTIRAGFGVDPTAVSFHYTALTAWPA